MSSTWVNSDFSAIHYLARKRQVVEPFQPKRHRSVRAIDSCITVARQLHKQIDFRYDRGVGTPASKFPALPPWLPDNEFGKLDPSP